MSAVRSRADRRRRMFRLAGFPALLGLLAWAGAVTAPPASANSGSNTVSVIS
jgi:hypothetical protein